MVVYLEHGLRAGHRVVGDDVVKEVRFGEVSGCQGLVRVVSKKERFGLYVCMCVCERERGGGGGKREREGTCTLILS